MGFIDELKKKTVEFDADSAFLAIASQAFGIVLTAAAGISSPVGAIAAGLGIFVPSLIKGIKIRDRKENEKTVYTKRFNEVARDCAFECFGEALAEDVLKVLTEVRLCNIDIYDNKSVERNKLVFDILSARNINVGKDKVDTFMDSVIIKMCRAVEADDELRKFVAEKLLLAGYVANKNYPSGKNVLYMRMSEEYCMKYNLRTHLRNEQRIKRYLSFYDNTVNCVELKDWFEPERGHKL